MHRTLTSFNGVALTGCAVLALSIGGAFAQNSAVEGLGSLKCSKVIEAATSDEVLMAGIGAWVSGFVSAANIYEDKTFDLTPWQTTELSAAQVANACQNQPDATLVDATTAYVRFLLKDRLQTPSAYVALRSEGKQVFIYEEVLIRIRTNLLENGYLGPEVPIDDAKALVSALAKFQAQQGLSATGLPDQRTMTRLMK